MQTPWYGIGALGVAIVIISALWLKFRRELFFENTTRDATGIGKHKRFSFWSWLVGSKGIQRTQWQWQFNWALRCCRACGCSRIAHPGDGTWSGHDRGLMCATCGSRDVGPNWPCLRRVFGIGAILLLIAFLVHHLH